MHHSVELKDCTPFFPSTPPSTSPINTSKSVQEKPTLSRIETTRREAMSLEKAPKKRGLNFSKKRITKKESGKEEVSEGKMELILESLKNMRLEESPTNDERSNIIPCATSASLSTNSKSLKQELIIFLVEQMLGENFPQVNPPTLCLLFLSIEGKNPSLKK
ncbi:hypothetical protein [Criblamydia sequanensis]|uniref:Uncharacterized protein n=1 Tax=Candidatus Criblamydia sequanensis CRIB-18 TaxID=1437425 RepID=A0A090E3K2_9BACT|nr:hypothetical protein [Criblamydia sequanensis]CDR35149.1 hypothetical protein CSEC_2343 [Criblamydia sequanensis CRIB-18]